jgi:hypothetical protein
VVRIRIRFWRIRTRLKITVCALVKYGTGNQSEGKLPIEMFWYFALFRFMKCCYCGVITEVSVDVFCFVKFLTESNNFQKEK